MQKISSIDKKILKIQQILRSHEIATLISNQKQPKIIKITFTFSKFWPICKNQFIPSIHS